MADSHEKMHGHHRPAQAAGRARPAAQTGLWAVHGPAGQRVKWKDEKRPAKGRFFAVIIKRGWIEIGIKKANEVMVVYGENKTAIARFYESTMAALSIFYNIAIMVVGVNIPNWM